MDKQTARFLEMLQQLTPEELEQLRKFMEELKKEQEEEQE